MNSLLRRLRHVRNLGNKALVQFQERYVRGRTVVGMPFQLTLEPGNVCNLRCPLCATTFREKRVPSGMLKLDNARKIIDRFPWTVHLVLSSWGEPFLNKEIFEIIAYAKARDIDVRMESNFTLFDEKKCHRLVDSKLDTLVVALDGASQETYEKYRVGGVFADAIQNVETLKRVQKERNDFSTHVIWKFVVNQYNEHEVETAREWAKKLGLGFETVVIWVPESEAPKWLPKIELEARRTGEGAPPKCHHLWQDVTVNFNGDLFPCCSEFAPSDALINVIDKPFKGIWNSETFRARRALNKGPVNCDECHGDKETNWYKTWLGADSGRQDPEDTSQTAAAQRLREGEHDASVSASSNGSAAASARPDASETATH